MINSVELEPGLGVSYSPEAELIGHECGVYGQISPEPVHNFFQAARTTQAIQNRGDQAFGGFILDAKTGNFDGHKAPGSVDDVLKSLKPKEITRLAALTGKIVVTQVRWGTDQESSPEDRTDAAQPWINKSFAGSHNGSTENARRAAVRRGISPAECATDSIALHKVVDHDAELYGMIPSLTGLRDEIKGAYALVMSREGKLYGMRDPNGIRPLSIGKKEDGSYLLASESVVFDAEGAEFVRDVEPGEIVEISEGKDGLELVSYPMPDEAVMAECSLDIGYFRRANSLFRGKPAHVWRRQLGEQMAYEAGIDNPNDYVVVGIPESGIPAAEAFAETAGVQYIAALTKVVNKRSFTAATKKEQQAIAAKKIEIDIDMLKTSLWDEQIQEYKNLILIDDSLISGNMITQLTQQLHKLGIPQEKINVIIPFPELVDSCHLGSAIPADRLLSRDRDYDTQRDQLGINSLQYLSLEGFRSVIPQTCGGCFGDEYPVARLGLGGLATNRL